MATTTTSLKQKQNNQFSSASESERIKGMKIYSVFYCMVSQSSPTVVEVSLWYLHVSTMSVVNIRNFGVNSCQFMI